MPALERWRRVQDIYERARQCDPPSRAAFLDDACSGDHELRREVESLLGYATEAERFMEAPAGAEKEADATVVAAEGLELGSYKILSLLGAGGMGKVYLARDTRLGRTVAIKILATATAADEERKRRFMQEARSASALNHPNIVTIHDIASHSGTDFLVMEYVEGQSLHQRIPAKGLSVKESLAFATQIVSALEAAHAAGIVHRDIKPANVMVTEKGVIKVLDFGLAKLTEPEQSNPDVRTDAAHTREGVILGTASYMSPEQASGKRVDARSDIFAVGLVLYEMLTGRRAFDRGTVLATLGAVMYEEPVPVNQIVNGVPLELEKLIERTLRKDPDRRLQTMADLRVGLEDLQQPTASGTGLPAAPVKKRSPWMVWAAVAAVVLTVAAIAFVLTNREQTAPAVADLTFKRLTDMDGWEVLPGWNRDGTMIAFGNNKEGSMDLFIMPVASGDVQQITRTPWDEVAPRWSPDFKYLAFVADRGTGSKVYLMPALGGPEREIAETGINSPDHFAGSLAVLGSTPWSPQSQDLLYTRVESGLSAIWRINANDLTKSQVTRPGTTERDSNASWSSDGTQIAFVRNISGQGTTIWIASADGSNARQVAKDVNLGGPSWSADGKKILFTSQNQIWEIDLESTNLRRITNSPSWDWFPIFSMDGRLAYVKFDDHRVDLYKGRPGTPKDTHEPFTDDTSENFFPSFSRNGKTAIYQTNRTGNNEIYVKGLDGTGDRNLTVNPAEDIVPSYAPDGSDEIVFVSNRNDKKPQVWVMGPNGESPRLLSPRLVPGSLGGWSAGSVTPHWSPDGRKIGFIGIGDDGGNALFVVDRDGRNERKLHDRVGYFDWYRDDRHIIYERKSKEGITQLAGLDLETKVEVLLIPVPALEPALSPDGANLLYTSAESHFNMNLWVLPLRRDPNGLPLPAGKPVQVTDGRSRWHAHKGAWSPDGQTIIYTRDSDQGDIYTIENYR